MWHLIEASSDWIVWGAKLKTKSGTTQSKPALEIYSPVLQHFSVVNILLVVVYNCYDFSKSAAFK